jgi:hypothetical protein
MNIVAYQMALVATDLFDLCSFATPVVPELVGKGIRKKPSHMQSTVPSQSTHTPCPTYRCSSRRSSPPSLDFPTPPVAGERGIPKLQTVSSWSSSLRASFSLVPCPSPFVPNTYLIVRNPPVPSPNGLRYQGAAFINTIPLR